MVKILYSPRFKKSYLRLERRIREQAAEKIDILRADPFDARLRTHKLKGVFEGYYAFSIDYSCRAIFSFDSDGGVNLHTIGGHEIYG